MTIRDDGQGNRGRMLRLAAPALIVAATPVQAATPAGTMIRNVATLDTGSQVVTSNEVVLTVARVIDVAVAPVVPRAPIGTDARQEVAFTVRNTGNAEERFDLSAGADAGATVAGIAVDGSATTAIVLAAGETRRVVVLVEGAAAASGDVRVALTAAATTGQGAPGSAIGDAVVGPGGGRATGTAVLTRDGGGGAAAGGPSLVKSQSVRAPDGSARVMPGAIVTYRLEARFDAATPAVAIDDRVPDGTAYVAGSMTLDGAAQSDAADTDAARFDGAAIHVALGDIAAPATRTVQFQVRIQ